MGGERLMSLAIVTLALVAAFALWFSALAVVHALRVQ